MVENYGVGPVPILEKHDSDPANATAGEISDNVMIGAVPSQN